MTYFIIKNNVQHGPFTIDELRTQNISSETLVWTEGMTQWEPAWKIEALRTLLHEHRETAGSMPPPPPIVDTEEQERNRVEQEIKNVEHRDVKKKKSPWLWFGLLFAAIIILMAVTNPSKEAHRLVIKENVSKGLEKAMSEQDNDILTQGLNIFGQLIAAPIIDIALNSMLEYNNYLILSTTSIVTPDGNSTISYGLFGKVFTADKDKIGDAMSSAFGSKKIKEMVDNISNSDLSSVEESEIGYDNDNSETTDTSSLTKQIGNAIIDHVGKEVKKQVKENADSSISKNVGALVDDVIKMIKDN